MENNRCLIAIIDTDSVITNIIVANKNDADFINMLTSDDSNILIPEKYELYVGIGDTIVNKDFSSFDSRIPTEAAIALQRVLSKRNILLAMTDFWALQDTPDMTEEQINFRQALRDITDQPGYPLDVTFPNIPDEIAALGQNED